MEAKLSSNHVGILTRFHQSIVGGDIPTAMELVHPECVLNEADGLPYGGDYIGGEGFLQLATVFTKDFDVTVHSWQAHDAGELVVAQMSVTLQSKETGRTLDTSVVELYRFTDEQISGIDVFYKDTKAVVDLVPGAAGLVGA
ncbi:nuclear transport factor 2 family protein [Nocardia sp. NPDC059246]|uniref:nuclear transport factor 2 family protein n=1 Tax=unclassified Nocardia TaxID=2637762 RepID=UPI0036A34D0B